MLKRASQVQLGLSTFNLLFYFKTIFKNALALEAGPNKWSNRIQPLIGFTRVRGVGSQASNNSPPPALGVGVAAVMRSSPQIKLARLSSLLPRLRATTAEQGPPRGAGTALPRHSALQNLIRWLVSPRTKQINTKIIHLSYGTPAASVGVAADATLWEVFWHHKHRPPVPPAGFVSSRAPHG